MNSEAPPTKPLEKNPGNPRFPISDLQMVKRVDVISQSILGDSSWDLSKSMLPQGRLG
jgi:hypothetical protein